MGCSDARCYCTVDCHHNLQLECHARLILPYLGDISTFFLAVTLAEIKAFQARFLHSSLSTCPLSTPKPRFTHPHLPNPSSLPSVSIVGRIRERSTRVLDEGRQRDQPRLRTAPRADPAAQPVRRPLRATRAARRPLEAPGGRAQRVAVQSELPANCLADKADFGLVRLPLDQKRPTGSNARSAALHLDR